MTKNHAVLAGPLITALAGLAFCVWTALGNEVSFCVTTGCTLYQDFTIGKISLWWYGTAAFSCLAAASLLGQATIGRFLAALFLLGDIFLLLLMALTAPCVSCLLAAFLFALCYVFFRRASRSTRESGRFSPLLWVWILLFVVNIGQVAKAQFDVWAILDESGQPSVRMFFSPSCRYCVEGVNALSGNINVAFYPIADSDADVARIQTMMVLLSEGQNLAEALALSRDAEAGGFWQYLNPATLLLRFRLLCNKAHLFAQGSHGVPFLEYRGLPPFLTADETRPPAMPSTPSSGGSADLPAELLEFGQCGGVTPCPPAETQLP